jgi:uncharacterized protein YukE
VPTATLAPAQTFEIPKPPTGDSAAARQLAAALRHAADEVVASQRQAHGVLEDAFQSWTGSSATAVRHPLESLDLQTQRVSRALNDAGDQLDHYAHVLDKAHEQHHWSLGKILTVAAVVVVTTAAVVVTVGAATPAAAAADAAVIGGEVAATGAAVAAASVAAVEAAEAVSVAVRALQALRAVATFLKPQVYVTAGLTDYEAFWQVESTGHLDLGALGLHAAENTAFGIAGGGLAGAFGRLGAEAANPVAHWVLPKLAMSAGWGTTAAFADLLLTGEISPGQVAAAMVFAAGGTVTEDLLARLPARTRFAGVQLEVYGRKPPKRIPGKVDAVLDFITSHNGAAPKGYKGNKAWRNGNTMLPPGSYLEYDIELNLPGVDRNSRRLVIDESTGRAFYTDSHYVDGFRRVR